MILFLPHVFVFTAVGLQLPAFPPCCTCLTWQRPILRCKSCNIRHHPQATQEQLPLKQVGAFKSPLFGLIFVYIYIRMYISVRDCNHRPDLGTGALDFCKSKAAKKASHASPSRWWIQRRIQQGSTKRDLQGSGMVCEWFIQQTLGNGWEMAEKLGDYIFDLV